MRTMTNALLFTAGLACFGFLGCDSDEDDTVTETGGSAGEDSGGSGGASGGSGGRSGGSGGVEGGSGGASGGSAGASGGQAGSGGAAPITCDVDTRGDRSEEVVTDSLSGTLDPAKVYVLEGNVYVNSGDTLTIPPCTRIEGDSATKGTLIVTRGARILAEGSADAPILFTARGDALAGSWGGLLILGSAPVSLGADVNVEGLSDDAKHKYGGTDAADDSGALSYVRIEYSGIDLGNGNEVNGLSLAGVGSGTTINHVMVRDTLDDCFEWFGGTVNADHLVCVNGGDDMFDTDDGFQGTIRYVFGQHGAQSSSDPNGLEWDGTSDTAGTFTTEVTLENATLCSNEGSLNGMVLRRGITGTLDKLVAVGFPTGIDLRDDPSGISITNSTLLATTLADADSTDDDGGVDDGAWFTDGTGNGTATPGFTAAQCMAATPAASVFDSGVGAFEGDADWARGAWTGW